MKTRRPRGESDAIGPPPVSATGGPELRYEAGDALMEATRPSMQHCFGGANAVASAFTCSSHPKPPVRKQSTVRWGHRQAGVARSAGEQIGVDPTLVDPTLVDPPLVDPTLVNPESGPRSPNRDVLPRSAVLRSATLDDALPEASGPERFVENRVVARGGMGTVHVARDKVMLRQVALKSLAASDQTDPSILQQFVEEAQITGQLAHPNIVPVYDLALDSSQRCFFSMKYVDGETYTELMHQYHAAPEDSERLYRLLQIFLKVCDAIAFAHERGVVHCDLKPDNVMVGSHGQVYVMDWGVALLRELPGADSSRTVRVRAPGRDGQNVGGTPSYMAPEQAWGRPDEIDHRTDVYGLGGLLHYLLTAKAPNYDTSRLNGIGNPRDITRESPLRLVPPGLCRIAERALSARPQRRQASVGELKSQVEEFLAGGGWFATETFPEGAIIIRQGDAGDSAYVITEGECDVFLEYNEGPVLVRTMGPGEVFGETAVLTGKPRSATVTAKTTVQVRVITKASLEQELRRNPLLGTFVRTVVGRFAEYQATERLSFAPPSSK